MAVACTWHGFGMIMAPVSRSGLWTHRQTQPPSAPCEPTNPSTSMGIGQCPHPRPPSRSSRSTTKRASLWSWVSRPVAPVLIIPGSTTVAPVVTNDRVQSHHHVTAGVDGLCHPSTPSPSGPCRGCPTQPCPLTPTANLMACGAGRGSPGLRCTSSALRWRETGGSGGHIHHLCPPAPLPP